MLRKKINNKKRWGELELRIEILDMVVIEAIQKHNVLFNWEIESVPSRKQTRFASTSEVNCAIGQLYRLSSSHNGIY